MGALGYVMHVPEEEKYLNTQKELEAMLVGYLGGRAAEELVFDTVTTELLMILSRRPRWPVL
jgi:cell division protease FtsH